MFDERKQRAHRKKQGKTLLYVAGGALVAGVVVYFLLSKK